MVAAARNLELKSNWVWKECKDGNLRRALYDAGWRTAQAYPSEIHVELLKAKMILDPYIGFNEHQVQCKSPNHLLVTCT